MREFRGKVSCGLISANIIPANINDGRVFTSHGGESFPESKDGAGACIVSGKF
jgi:hypothetical protein